VRDQRQVSYDEHLFDAIADATIFAAERHVAVITPEIMAAALVGRVDSPTALFGHEFDPAQFRRAVAGDSTARTTAAADPLYLAPIEEIRVMLDAALLQCAQVEQLIGYTDARGAELGLLACLVERNAAVRQAFDEAGVSALEDVLPRLRSEAAR
jgi:hypothetical protein